MAVRHVASTKQTTPRQKMEYFVIRALVGGLGVLPRTVARAIGVSIGGLARLLLGRLRSSGMRNLEIAFPDQDRRHHAAVLRGVYRSLGWQIAEFALMSGYTQQQTRSFARVEGLDHYLQAKAQGRGVLIVTGHLGAWEFSSYYHSLMGHPMSMVIRRLDNPLVDRFVNGIRSRHGNRVIDKDEYARGMLHALRAGETIGILMDTNMTPPQGLFVPFFGLDACTGSGLARTAMATGAVVLPGFMVWHKEERKYVLHFGAPIQLAADGSKSEQIIENTARFTAVIEQWVRRFPDQWLWVHRRWKTRPAGEPALY